MKKCKVSTGLGGLSDVGVSEKAAVVIASMDGNTSFQNPFPSIPNMITLKGNFDVALAKAEFGSVYDNAVKDELRVALENALFVLGTYVENNCQNQVSILVSSGFSLRKSPVRALPETPVNLSVKDGVHSGQVVVSFKLAQRVAGYNVRYTNDLNSGTWSATKFFTKTKFTLSGLVKGKDVWVQVQSLNANGESAWCNAVLLETVR